MIEPSYFVRGLSIGFLIAAPVGPIGVLCIRRTLTMGRTVGFLSGLGAATADAMYGSIAGFGLTFMSGLLIDQSVWLRWLGGGFLCYLGLKTFLSQVSEESAEVAAYGLWSAYISTLFLTLTNPATILTFAAIFANPWLVIATDNYFAAAILVLGVFTGSALWWLLLSGGISLFRARFNLSGLRWLNRISGVVLLAFGIIALSVWE